MPAASVLLLLAALTIGAPKAAAIELCSPEAKALMGKAGIREGQIAEVCRAAARSGSPLTLSVKRAEDELGYCRVTLALHNNSTQYLNQMALASANGHFEIFKFHNIMPGKTGYAAARSRILLACDELSTVGVLLRWPASLRIGDRSPHGQRLQRLKPALLDSVMRWNR